MLQSPLELRGVVKRYTKAVEIGPISLNLRAGQFLSLLGPSGCGKSTLLRCIAGFAQVDAGDVLIGGRSVLKSPPNRRNVGFVFQNYALFPHLNISDNIAFGLRRRGVSRPECTRLVGEILERVGLNRHGQRRPSELSGGQQQRVALARVLVLNPEVLLLDEPLSSLDRKLRVQMRAELRRVHREFQKTVVYVTHDQEEALSLSDQIAIMLDHSKIAQYGTPSEIYERPASAEVADFIGDCNIFPCTVKELSDNDGLLCAATPSGSLWRAAPGNDLCSVGSAANVLFRPECVRLGAADDGVPSNSFSARLTERVYGGQRVNYVGMLQSGDSIQLTVPQEKMGGPLPEIGATVMCHLRADDVFLFHGPT